MVKTALTIPMTTRRLSFAQRSFGRRLPFLADVAIAPAPAISDDFKLFATTYVAGFLFVWLYLL
jgi:hypothetical protein